MCVCCCCCCSCCCYCCSSSSLPRVRDWTRDLSLRLQNWLPTLVHLRCFPFCLLYTLIHFKITLRRLSHRKSTHLKTLSTMETSWKQRPTRIIVPKFRSSTICLELSAATDLARLACKITHKVEAAVNVLLYKLKHTKENYSAIKDGRKVGLVLSFFKIVHDCLMWYCASSPSSAKWAKLWERAKEQSTIKDGEDM